MESLETLPLELTSAIVSEVQSPVSVVALSGVSRSLRDTLPGLAPLELPTGYVLEWNVFAGSGYNQIRGEGELQMPIRGLSVASRRVRGTLRLYDASGAVPDTSDRFSQTPSTLFPVPSGLFVCLRVRRHLYPTSTFRLRNAARLVLEWRPGFLCVNLRLEEWEKQEDAIHAFLQETPLETFAPAFIENVGIGRSENYLYTKILNRLSTVLNARTVIFGDRHFFGLPPTVQRIEIPDRIHGYEIGYYEGRDYIHSYPQVQELVIRNYMKPLFRTEEDRLDVILEDLPNLRSIIYHIQPQDPYANENLKDIESRIPNLRSRYPHISFSIVTGP